MKPLHFLWILLSLPYCGFGQFPISEDRIKNELSQRYWEWQTLSDGLSSPNLGDFDSIPVGCHYDLIRLQPVLIPGISQYERLVGAELFPNYELQCEGDKSILIGFSDWAPRDRGPAYFLMGITADKKIHFLSGNVLLDPYHTEDFEALAQMRLYYLLPEKIQLLGVVDGCHIFKAYSKLLNQTLRFKMYDRDAYSIWLKGEQRPFVEVGNVALYENAWRKQPFKER